MMGDPTLQDITRELSKNKRALEDLMIKALRDFEDSTGLKIHDIELFHTIRPNVTDDVSQIEAIRIDVRLK